MNFNYEKKLIKPDQLKIKMFDFYNPRDDEIANEVNEFIEDKEVIDIKFQTVAVPNMRVGYSNITVMVMVIYNA